MIFVYDDNISYHHIQISISNVYKLSFIFMYVYRGVKSEEKKRVGEIRNRSNENQESENGKRNSKIKNQKTKIKNRSNEKNEENHSNQKSFQ